MVDKLVDVILEKFCNFLSFKKNIDTLERNITVLKNKAADVKELVGEAKLRSGKKRKREVEDWLREVEQKIEEFDRFKVDFQASRFYSRMLFAERAHKMIAETMDLTRQGEFSGGILLDVHEKKGLPLVAVKGKGRAFEENLKEIWKWIMNDEISSIGIYGMGGVGKTTLATHIHNNLLNEVQFGHVYWVIVSQETSIYQLQNKIAKTLHVDLSEEDDEIKRAAIIFHALKERAKAKFMLILDDMWTFFDLVRIGIPLEEVGSKLIVTSRSLDVCHRIGCQVKIKVKPLGGEEAWLLFLEKLGRCTKLPLDVEKIAKSMAKRCDGLPLGIITVAGSMRGVDDIHEWRNALEELKDASDRGTDDEVYQVLVYSFNRLRDQRLKNCFLYCSLYPEDYIIRRDDLIRMFIVEGLIEKYSNRQKQVDQGHEILNRLENVCLLEKTRILNRDVMGVKMHDLVRDMAKKLTKVNPKYMVKAGIRLEQIPDDNDWEEDLEKVSLMHCEILLKSISVSPKCPKLSTLIFRDNDCLLRIPSSFFDQLCGLKVLDLSRNTRLEELPNCISNLENLTALLLNGCHALRFVPNLGKLKALMELDLYDTAIEDVPEGLEKLTKLKCLNIATKKLKMIPAGLVSKLTHLQILNMNGKMVGIQVEDLEDLQQLECFHGWFLDVYSFSQFVSFRESHKRPRFYGILVGPNEQYFSFVHMVYFCSVDITLKSVVLSDIRIGENGIVFPEDMQRLTIRECVGLGGCLADAFSIWNIRRRGLKVCEIWRNKEIQCITRLSSPSAPLWSIEHMSLSNLPNLVGLFECESLAFGNHLPHGAFSCLRFLTIIKCDKFTKLFTPKLLEHLKNLETIEIKRCSMLEEIIADDEGCSRPTTVSLPKLKVLRLWGMQHLRSIWNGTIICNSIESIRIKSCPSLERLPLLQPSPPPSLKHILLAPRELMESLERDHALETFVFMTE